MARSARVPILGMSQRVSRSSSFARQRSGEPINYDYSGTKPDIVHHMMSSDFLHRPPEIREYNGQVLVLDSIYSKFFQHTPSHIYVNTFFPDLLGLQLLTMGRRLTPGQRIGGPADVIYGK